jgi:hypothetical protein
MLSGGLRPREPSISAPPQTHRGSQLADHLVKPGGRARQMSASECAEPQSSVADFHIVKLNEDWWPVVDMTLS